MGRFTLPRDIYYGENSIQVLKELKGEKAVVVSGAGSMKRYGFLDNIINNLEDAGIKTKLIEGIETDLSLECVVNGTEIMKDFEPDLIVGVGGRAAIDAAKAMWLFYEQPDLEIGSITKPFSVPEHRNRAKFIAIPSNSGTAGEASGFLVVNDYSADKKYPLVDFSLVPDIAIIDPDLAQTMPQKLVANSGMNALAHAVEAYISKLHSPFTDPLALQAIVMIYNNLLKSYDGDKKARGEMHAAECLSAIAFSNTFFGLVHNMARETNTSFRVSSSCASAIFLPYIIDFNKVKCMERYAQIAEALKLPGKNEEELVDSLTNAVRNMNLHLKTPLTLKEYGVSEKEFKAALDGMVKNVHSSMFTDSNPRKADEEEIRKLFLCAYNGLKVEF